MASIFPDDILLPDSNKVDGRPSRSGIAAIVPTTIAIIGVATILVGRVTVSEIVASDLLGGMDPLAVESSEAASKTNIDGMTLAR